MSEEKKPEMNHMPHDVAMQDTASPLFAETLDVLKLESVDATVVDASSIEESPTETVSESAHTSSALHELNHLIEEHNDTVEMLKEHHQLHNHENNAHIVHAMDELRAEILHMEEVLPHTHQHEFFNHHAESLLHANEHWMHLQHHLEELFSEIEEEELQELMEQKERIKHLLKEIQREAIEKKTEAEHHTPHMTMHAMPEDE